MRPPHQLLHPMILRISHVQIPGGIEGYTPRVAELSSLATRAANNLDGLIVGVENLNAAVPEFPHVLEAFFIDADRWIAEVARTGARMAVAAQEFAVTGINLDPMITRVGHVEVVMRVDAQTFGSIEIVRSLAALAEGELELHGLRRRCAPAALLVEGAVSVAGSPFQLSPPIQAT